MYPDISNLNLRLPREQIETAGETIHFDGPHSPATGVIVLRFRDDVDDPRHTWEDSSEWLTSFMGLSFDEPDPEIRMPSDQTLIMQGPVDPEAVFGP